MVASGPSPPRLGEQLYVFPNVSIQSTSLRPSCPASGPPPCPLPASIPPQHAGTDITKQLRIAVVNGIGNVRPLLEAVAAGRAAYDFIEVMTCPGGCIGGGGQPKWKGTTTLQVGGRVEYTGESCHLSSQQ